LLGVAHQLVEVDLGSRHEGPNAAAAFDDTFAFEKGQSMPSGHKADLVKAREVALGSNAVSGS
jgi:hypothetical protein